MQLNALHMRFGAIAGGIIVLAMFFAFGGSFGGDRVIQLDFSLYPEVFEGCQVEIDGKVVGTLEPVGQATRNGFKVRKGSHKVRVVHPELASRTAEVELEQPGEKVRFLLDIAETYDERGGSKPVITLQL
jgi:hypothetical protein